MHERFPANAALQSAVSFLSDNLQVTRLKSDSHLLLFRLHAISCSTTWLFALTPQSLSNENKLSHRGKDKLLKSPK